MESDLESLLPADLDFVVSDDVLSDMPLPDNCTNGIQKIFRSVFINCAINFE